MIRRVLKFFVYQIHFLRSFLRRPHTDRFPDDVLKKLRRNRYRDSCEKNATGTENTGIGRIPAGICNIEQSTLVSGFGAIFSPIASGTVVVCKNNTRVLGRSGPERGKH
jgi:hypothetical protein